MTEPEQPLLEFPCDFPIKAMGRDDKGFELVVVEIVRRHAPDLTEGAVRTRPSKGGNFLSVTINLRATSQQQIDAIYMDLTACEQVLMAI